MPWSSASAVPALIAVSTNYIEVQPNGDVDFTHVFRYDSLVRGDLPEYTHHIGSFIPHTLCKAHPTDYTQTTTRPYTTSPQPAIAAKPFSEYLRNGLILDITVEPQEPVVFPPVPSNVATYSQALSVAGGIPRGWTLDLEAVFANLAPPMRPWEAAGTCERSRGCRAVRRPASWQHLGRRAPPLDFPQSSSSMT